MIARLWHRAMVAIGVRAPVQPLNEIQAYQERLARELVRMGSMVAAAADLSRRARELAESTRIPPAPQLATVLEQINRQPAMREYETQANLIGTDAYDAAAFIAAGRALIAASRTINAATDFSVFDQVQAATNDALRGRSQ